MSAVVVRLLNAPTLLADLAVERTDELIRELRLGSPRLRGDLAERFLTLVDRMREDGHDAILEPLEADTIVVSEQGVYDALDLARLLDEADSHCAAGELMTLARDPEMAAYRWWQVTEIVRQRHGLPATAYAA